MTSGVLPSIARLWPTGEASARSETKANAAAWGECVVSSGGDRRTGYYVAGHDWPAISNDLSISRFYEALEEIEDDDVAAAVKSLQGARKPSS